MKVTVFLFAIVVALSGCSSIYTDRNPRVDLSQFKRFYVETRLADNNKIDEAIVADLRARGFEASSGPLTMMPDKVDALIHYQDDWAWDFKSYLLQLQITVRHPHRYQAFATGVYRQPSPITKPVPEVIRLLFDPLFQVMGN